MDSQSGTTSIVRKTTKQSDLLGVQPNNFEKNYYINIFNERFSKINPVYLAKGFKYFIFYFLIFFCFFMLKSDNLEFISFFLLLLVSSITHYFIACDILSLEVTQKLYSKINNLTSQSTTNSFSSNDDTYIKIPNLFSIFFVLNLFVLFFSMILITLFFQKINLLFSVLFSNEESLNLSILNDDLRKHITLYENLLFCNILLIAFIFFFFMFLFPYSITDKIIVGIFCLLLFTSIIITGIITHTSFKISNYNSFDFKKTPQQTLPSSTNNYFYPFGSHFNLFSFLQYKFTM
jgi:hypothetical protein